MFLLLYLSSVLCSVSTYAQTAGIREVHPSFVLYSIVLIKVTGKNENMLVLFVARSGWDILVVG